MTWENFFFLLTCVVSAVSRVAPEPEYHRYIVLGAGPGGLQMAHYLASAGRDYLVVDRNPHGQ